LDELLWRLCVELGLCLPASEQARLAADPPDGGDALTDAIFAAEGLYPRPAHQGLWNQARARVSAYFNNLARSAHQHSADHRDEIEASDLCGCFYCVSVFAPGEIREWTDNGKTALCPYCGIDSVIGDRSGAPIAPGFLTVMREEWFEK